MCGRTIVEGFLSSLVRRERHRDSKTLKISSSMVLVENGGKVQEHKARRTVAVCRRTAGHFSVLPATCCAPLASFCGCWRDENMLWLRFLYLQCTLICTWASWLWENLYLVEKNLRKNLNKKYHSLITSHENRVLFNPYSLSKVFVDCFHGG